MNEKPYEQWNEQATLGEPICIKIKQLYYPKDPWVKCYRKVAEMFSMLKKKARKFFEGHTEEMMLKQLGKFSPEDIKEMLEG